MIVGWRHGLECNRENKQEPPPKSIAKICLGYKSLHPRNRHKTRLKLDHRFQLDHAGGNIASKVRSEDAGRWHLHRAYLSETWVRAVVVRRAEIWVIEEIKESDANSQYHFVPDKAGSLRDIKVSIEIVRIAEAVAALTEGNGTA